MPPPALWQKLFEITVLAIASVPSLKIPPPYPESLPLTMDSDPARPATGRQVHAVLTGWFQHRPGMTSTEQRQWLELGLLADRGNEPHPCTGVVLNELQPAGHLR